MITIRLWSLIITVSFKVPSFLLPASYNERNKQQMNSGGNYASFLTQQDTILEGLFEHSF